MLTDKQKEFIIQTRAVRLTFSGQFDLYNFPLLGAHTVEDAMEIDKKRKQFFKKEKLVDSIFRDYYTVSEDKFIDENGCSSVLY